MNEEEHTDGGDPDRAWNLAQLWKRFLNGYYDREDPPEEIGAWIKAHREDGLDELSSESYTIYPTGLEKKPHPETRNWLRPEEGEEADR